MGIFIFPQDQEKHPVDDAGTPSSAMREPTNSSPSFRCIHCSTPSPHLVRTYHGYIKLSECTNCQRNVDEYIEQENLLLGIDLILLRTEAYMHLLWNHHRQSISFGKYFALFNTFETYILYKHQPNVPLYFILSIFLIRVFYHAISYFAISMLLSRPSIPTSKSFFRRQLFLSMFLPHGVHVATLLVQVWENTQDVLFIGSILVLLYQVMGFHVLLQRSSGASLAFEALRLTICALILSPSFLIFPGTSELLHPLIRI